MKEILSGNEGGAPVRGATEGEKAVLFAGPNG